MIDSVKFSSHRRRRHLQARDPLLVAHQYTVDIAHIRMLDAAPLHEAIRLLLAAGYQVASKERHEGEAFELDIDETPGRLSYTIRAKGDGDVR